MGQSDRPLAHLGSIEQDILNHQFCVNAWSTKGKKIRSFVCNQNRTKLSQVKFLDRNKERDGKQELSISSSILVVTVFIHVLVEIEVLVEALAEVEVVVVAVALVVVNGVQVTCTSRPTTVYVFMSKSCCCFIIFCFLCCLSVY